MVLNLAWYIEIAWNWTFLLKYSCKFSSTLLFMYFKRYLDEAEREKMQYAQELKEYQQTEAFQITSAKIQDKRIKKGDNWVNRCSGVLLIGKAKCSKQFSNISILCHESKEI